MDIEIDSCIFFYTKKICVMIFFSGGINCELAHSTCSLFYIDCFSILLTITVNDSLEEISDKVYNTILYDIESL